MYTSNIASEMKDYIGWCGNITIKEDDLILSQIDKEDIVFPIKSDIVKIRIITGEELESYGIREVCGFTFIYLINLISTIKYVYK